MVSYTVLPNSMIVGVSGKRFTLTKEDARYEAMLNLIRSKTSKESMAANEGKPQVITDEEALEICDPSVNFAEEGVELKDGIVWIKGEAMPDELSTRIIAMKKEKIPIVQLLNFWENLKQNPSMNSVQQLYKFLENNCHPLTEDGYFIAYRSIRQDWKDFHTGTMDNSIGQVVSMPRNKVNDKPEQTCSDGLHVASWSYASSFGDSTRRMIEVKVNPKDVVCVPNDYQNTKMRVCEFEVLAEVKAPALTSFRSGLDMDSYNDENDEDTDFPSDDYDDNEDESSEKNYTEVEKDKVESAFDRFSDRYEGEGLVLRICEETEIDEDTVRDIIDAEEMGY